MFFEGTLGSLATPSSSSLPASSATGVSRGGQQTLGAGNQVMSHKKTKTKTKKAKTKMKMKGKGKGKEKGKGEAGESGRTGKQGIQFHEFTQKVLSQTKLESLSFARNQLLLAHHTLKQALRIDPMDAEAGFLHGYTLIFLKGNRSFDLGEAKRILERSLANDQSLSHAHFLLGFIHQREGNVREALREYQETLQLDPHNALALQARAYVHFVSGDRSRALQAYNRMSHDGSYNRCVMLANRGLIKLLNTRYQMALADLDAALQINPDYGLGLLYRAECLKRMGFPIESIQDYRRALPILSR